MTRRRAHRCCEAMRTAPLRRRTMSDEELALFGLDEPGVGGCRRQLRARSVAPSREGLRACLDAGACEGALVTRHAPA